MKFSEQRHSMRYSCYDLRYNQLKESIKRNARPAAGDIGPLSAQDFEHAQAFKEGFLEQLKEEHRRLNVFIHCRMIGITERLDKIVKKLGRLETIKPPDASDRLAKWHKQWIKLNAKSLEEQNDFETLYTFQAAQRTGFHRILEKYRRWTRDDDLGQRFKSEVVEQPDSLFQRELYQYIRRFFEPASPTPDETPQSASSPSDSQSRGSGSTASRSERLRPIPKAHQESQKRVQRSRKQRHRRPIQAEWHHYWSDFEDSQSDAIRHHHCVPVSQPFKLPGPKTLQGWAHAARNLFRRSNSGEAPDERSAASGANADEVDEQAASTRRRRRAREYGACRTAYRAAGRRRSDDALAPALRSRERTKFRFYSACLVFAMLLDVVLGVLQTTSPRRTRGHVDRAVLFGAACSLTLVGLALASMATRSDRLAWCHCGLVLVVAAAVAVGDALLVKAVFD